MSRPRHRKQRLSREPVEASIEELTPEGRGFASIDGKATFIDFALPGERVLFRYSKSSSKYDEGRAVEVLEASKDRVQPPCEHFGLCGGCSMQHLAPDAQILAKQDALLGHFRQLADVQPDSLLEPLRGPLLGYRCKARLGVKYVAKKGKVLVGFREKGKPYLAELGICKVLHPSVGERLESLGDLVMGLEARQTIPQIEVAVSGERTCLVFRHLKPLSDADLARLRDYAEQQQIQLMLQSAGPDSIQPLYPPQPDPLFYELPRYGVRIEFQAADFTQVNPAINERMVERALAFLDLQAGDRVLDLFSGLGNFTLPMARNAAHVTGVEGVESMVQKARHNAELNGIDNVEYHAADLSEDITGYPWLNVHYDKILLDPPRSGAMEMLRHLGKLNATKIVYISCHPATLARDTRMLVHELGYRLTAAGVMDMFPHTAHVESIAVFEK